MTRPSGDRLIRAAAALVVVAVAGFAAVVSFSHIYDLGHAHGQFGTADRLLPLSVDGLILAASLVLLHEARNRRPAPPLARFALWLGIGATLAANGAYGARFGVEGVVVSTWPAVAFIVAVEMLMGLVRRARIVSSAVPAGVPAHANGNGKLPTFQEIQARQNCSKETAKKARAEVARDRMRRTAMADSHALGAHTDRAAPAAR